MWNSYEEWLTCGLNSDTCVLTNATLVVPSVRAYPRAVNTYVVGATAYVSALGCLRVHARMHACMHRV